MPSSQSIDVDISSRRMQLFLEQASSDEYALVKGDRVQSLCSHDGRLEGMEPGEISCGRGQHHELFCLSLEGEGRGVIPLADSLSRSHSRRDRNLYDDAALHEYKTLGGGDSLSLDIAVDSSSNHIRMSRQISSPRQNMFHSTRGSRLKAQISRIGAQDEKRHEEFQKMILIANSRSECPPGEAITSVLRTQQNTEELFISDGDDLRTLSGKRNGDHFPSSLASGGTASEESVNSSKKWWKGNYSTMEGRMQHPPGNASPGNSTNETSQLLSDSSFLHRLVIPSSRSSSASLIEGNKSVGLRANAASGRTKSGKSKGGFSAP